MRELYKQKVNDYLTASNSRLKIIEGMINGSRKAEPILAARYLTEIKHNLEQIEEIVSIS